MIDPILVISDCCPVGCGYPVVLLAHMADGSVFGYCDACGCTWDPGQAQFEQGIHEIVSISARAPAGVRIASSADASAAGCDGQLLHALIPAEWDQSVDVLNALIDQQAEA